jgi:4-amino-4-deoxychorismate lyase
MLALLVDGQMPADPSQAIAANDRGLQYGDGLFETALLTGGRVRFLAAHLRRLASGCERLGILVPDRSILMREIETVISGQAEGVVKILVTRGAGGRGYRPAHDVVPTRVVALYPRPHLPAGDIGIRVRWCDTRLGRNARLAGIKHLNRLEQILAQAEWDDPTIEEGLMLDTEGELVCATAANLFLVRDGQLVTHDLRYCGVRGVMREHLLEQARLLGIPSSEEPLWPRDLERATEVFISNAVRGVRHVTRLDDRSWQRGAVFDTLRQTID